jgi:hypothetical protein
MSYLDTPRLIFSGQFQADPSTVNNDPEHFDTANFQSNYDQPGTPIKFPIYPNQGMSNGWWNPTGSAAWRFRDCVVTQVFYTDGTSTTDPTQDPVIGMPVNDPSLKIEGKLVDLDPQQQMVSEVWGFRVFVGEPASGGIGFGGDFQVAPFADIWFRVPTGTPDSCFGAFYQSVLNVSAWAPPAPGISRFLSELSAGGTQPQQLSIRFNVDAYDDNVGSENFTFGRVVGSIGLYEASEPVHFVAKRALQPAAPPQGLPTLNPAYAQVVDGMLTLDLSNSIPDQQVGGPPVALGAIQAALLPQGGPPVPLGDPIPYADAGWYESTAGIVSVQLNEQAGQAANTPLGVVRVGADNTLTPLLAEAANGMWLRADEFVFRLSPGGTAATTLYATAFGRPAADQQLSFGYDPSSLQNQVNAGPILAPQNVGNPEGACTFDLSADTGPGGTATLTISAGDPQNPRGYIDGQVYGINYGLGTTPPPIGTQTNPTNPCLLINPLIFDGYQAPAEPDWTHDVQPIFQQYANLYPVMRQYVQLDDYDSVVANASRVRGVFNAPINSTSYMPVTRDLSPARREMILSWLAQTPPLRTRADV